jgi:protein-S-isoprenylcysteine O-methyltransferase Ste14
MPPASSSAASRLVVWMGALLFVTSLIYCFVAYETAMKEPAESTDLMWPAAVNVLLFSAFALHHSVFARERVREWVRRLVPGGLERSAYVWIASLLFIAVCAWWQPVPGTAWRVTGGAAWLLRAVQIAGVLFTARSAAALDVFELAGVRQAETRSETTEFKTSGPYGWVRHPIYSGWFVMILAEPTMTATQLVFAVTSCAYLLVAIPFEEKSLRQRSGPAYAQYTRTVRWKLIPGVY